MGQSAGTAALAREVYDELTELGINQLATSARVIEHWSNAMGPGGYDTADAVREAIDKHTEDGTRIFLPMYHLLLADTEMAQGRSVPLRPRWTAPSRSPPPPVNGSGTSNGGTPPQAACRRFITA